jgi:hypothetical protein
MCSLFDRDPREKFVNRRAVFIHVTSSGRIERWVAA